LIRTEPVGRTMIEKDSTTTVSNEASPKGNWPHCLYGPQIYICPKFQETRSSKY